MRPDHTVLTAAGTLTPEAATALRGRVLIDLTPDESFALQRILCTVSTEGDTAAGTVADTLLLYIFRSTPYPTKPFSAVFGLASLETRARESAIVRFLVGEDLHYHVHHPIARVLSLLPRKDVTNELARYFKDEWEVEGETLKEKDAGAMASDRAAELAPAIASLITKLANLH